MISKNAVKYCCEPLELVENYKEAVESSALWHCHHRKETETGMSREKLKQDGLYYNRPASELIFLKHGEHIKLHNTGESNGMHGVHICGKNHWHYGGKTTEKQREAARTANSGKNHYNWKDICPMVLYTEIKVLKIPIGELKQKYGCSHATLYRRLNLRKNKQ